MVLERFTAAAQLRAAKEASMNDQTQQFRSWVNDASPDDLIAIGKAVMARIGQLDQTHQRAFLDQIKGDPTASKLLDQVQTT